VSYNDRLYTIWKSMKKRCTDPDDENARYYIDKGVLVCDEWLESYHAFRDWAMENGYEDHLTIDRINTNGNYEPSNCRFITMQQNSFNTSPRKNTSSKYKGVHWDSTKKKWRASIMKDGKKMQLGNFNLENDAALRYNEKAKELFGEFAYLNNIS
jgi:hypothetical protein